MAREPVQRRKPGRRAEDIWPARVKILREFVQIIIGAITILYGVYIGQKSNDPAIENKYTMQRIEELQQLRIENDQLRREQKQSQQ